VKLCQDSSELVTFTLGHISVKFQKSLLSFFNLDIVFLLDCVEIAYYLVVETDD
jgi:hypothetical protein